MKKYGNFKSIWILNIGFIIFSCASSVPVQQETVYRITDFSHVITLLQNNRETSPRMIFSFSLLDAAGTAGDIKFIERQLYHGQTFQQYRNDVIQEWQDIYFECREYVESQHTIPAVFNWEYIESMNFFLLKNRGMVVRRVIYEYSGGAHGLETVQYYVFDLADHRSLKLNEFFRDGVEQRLYSIILNELRRYNNLHSSIFLAENQPLSQGIFFDDDPALTDNFFINNEGLGLNWAPVSIAPYSEGSIEILLPWRSLRPLLQHNMMELLEKFGIYMFMM